MTPFAVRATALFVLAAIAPVALTAIVWLGFSRVGRSPTTAEAALVRAHLDDLGARRRTAVERLCRDDLAIDTLLRERAEGAPPGLDYDRQMQAAMDAAGLDVLWVIDPRNDRLLARGHRTSQGSSEVSEVIRQTRDADIAPFLLALGASEEKRFVVDECTIERGGIELVIVGGHRLTALRALDSGQIVVTASPGDDDVRLLELADSEGVVQTFAVWRSAIDRRAPPLLLWLATVAVVALGLALMFGGYLNRWLQDSAQELTSAATRVGRGDFETTVRDDGHVAFPATATAFNRMTRDLRDAREQLRQTERIAAWQEIARSLAHELKNPLSPIRLSIETLRKARARSHPEFDSLFEESTGAILHEVDRLRRIVDEFSRFARLPAPALRETDLREIVGHAAALRAEGPVSVEVRMPSNPVEARIDADQITQVLHNLMQNACDASQAAHPDGGGAVSLELEGSGAEARVRVQDDGPGISPERVEAIFAPYSSDKEGGTGLGLAISRRIVTEHGGRIEVESRPGKTVFTVVLPTRLA